MIETTGKDGWIEKKEFLAFITAIIIVLSPWIIRNAIVVNAILPTTTQAGDVVLGAQNELTFTSSARGGWLSCETQIKHEISMPKLEGKSEIEKNRIKLTFALDVIKKHKNKLPTLVLSKIGVWAGVHCAWLNSCNIRRILNMPYLLLTPLGFFLFIRYKISGNPLFRISVWVFMGTPINYSKRHLHGIADTIPCLATFSL